MASVQLEIQAALSSFRFNEAEMRRLLSGPTGGVCRDLARRAIRVEAAAKQNATQRPGPMVRTGRLRGSITWRLGADERGAYADIGSNIIYSIYVERGTSRMPAYPYLVPALSAARL